MSLLIEPFFELAPLGDVFDRADDPVDLALSILDVVSTHVYPSNVAARSQDAVLHVQGIHGHPAVRPQYACTILGVQRSAPCRQSVASRRERYTVDTSACRAHVKDRVPLRISDPEAFRDVISQLMELLFTVFDRALGLDQLVAFAAKAAHEKNNDRGGRCVECDAGGEVSRCRCGEGHIADEVFDAEVSDYRGCKRGPRSAVPGCEQGR